MAFPQGCDFRATVGYVTDVSPDDFFTHTTTYPHTTAQGNTAGWDVSSNLDSRNRSTSVVKLAGINFQSNGTANPISSFRIDLPGAGDYNIRAACGDASSAQQQYVRVYDNTTLLATIANAVSTSSNNFADAGGTVRTAAAWPGSNVLRTLTFTSAICRVKIADPSAGATSSTLAYFYIEAVAAAADIVPLYGQISGLGIQSYGLRSRQRDAMYRAMQRSYKELRA